MNTLRAFVSAVVAAGCVPSAMAGIIHASSIESFTQGLANGGSAVNANRSDTARALGAPQLTDTLNFVALGFGGEIVLGFDEPFTADSIVVHETTYGNRANYPESADVYVGSGSGWTLIKGIDNNFGETPAMSLADMQALGAFNYLRIVDTTNSSDHGSSADGFDVDGVSVNVVPAPGTAALACVSLALVARRRRS